MLESEEKTHANNFQMEVGGMTTDTIEITTGSKEGIGDICTTIVEGSTIEEEGTRDTASGIAGYQV